MRIGEIAGLVGVTSRAIRHYHHIGLLPEPRRRANGYRVYSVRDAVLLARIRRLTELGLGLDEVRDVLADDAGRELVEVLGELDADLARQEHEIRERRRRLAGLLHEPLTDTDRISPALAELLGAAPATDSPSAVRDREHLALLDASGSGREIYAALRPLADEPAALALFLALHAACVTRPHVVGADGSLRIRYGGLFDLRVPASSVTTARVERRYPEGKLVRLHPDGVLDIAVGSQTTVTVELTGPVTFVRPLGKQGSARTIRFHADDPRAVVAALTRGRTAPSPTPGPPA